MKTQTVGAIVEDKAIQELVAVPASASVSEAVSGMSRAGVGAVVIRNEDGLVDGIFTERDLLRRVVEAGRDPATTPMSMVMTADVHHVAPTTTVEEALRLMTVNRHRHLLVIDGPHVHGLISIGDLVYWLVGVEGGAGESAVRAVQGAGGGAR